MTWLQWVAVVAGSLSALLAAGAVIAASRAARIETTADYRAELARRRNR